MTQRVIVVGGSIAGLTTALLLRDLGFEVDVFERSPVALEGRGAGIVLHPATVRYLVERVGTAVDEISSSAHWFRYLDRTGAVASESPCDYRFTSYNSLYRRLLAQLPDEHYHLGEECVRVEPVTGGAVAAFASGREERAALLVCADGINSAARQWLLPGVEPQYAEYVAWRGTLHEARLSPVAFAALSEAIVYHVLPEGGHMLSYPIPNSDGSVVPGERLANWLWYRNVLPGELTELLTGKGGVRFAVSLPQGQVPDERLTALREDAVAALPPAFVEAIAQTAEPFAQAIFDLEVERMVFGRVCILGDAAFVARPHIAAGTAKATDDAWQLAQALADSNGDVGTALSHWETRQLAVGRNAIERARHAGDLLQHGRWTVGAPLPFGLREAGDSALA